MGNIIINSCPFSLGKNNDILNKHEVDLKDSCRLSCVYSLDKLRRSRVTTHHRCTVSSY